METSAHINDEDGWVGKAAVIGLACRFPGASDVRQYWDNLVNGVESIDRFDAVEAAINRFNTSARASDGFVGAEAIVPGVEEFDHELFGYTLGEARRLDPQLRIGLQCAHQALEDAACAGLSARDGKVGVFFAASMSTYMLQQLSDENVDGLGMLLGSDKDHIATTIAYRLGLTGPAVNIGSGCSSSAAALHHACLSLATYQCDIAIVGGASIIFPQRQGHVYREGGVYSKDGRCRPFSGDASGTVGGSGVGVLVLKRLDDAVHGHHAIYGVIAGSACLNDGRRKVGYAAPSVEGQVETIRTALAAAGAQPESFGYIEAHGTGTPLGDPIEVDALSRVFALSDGRTQYCALGSVKANIGHLDSASGIASLIKAVMCVHTRQRPPQIAFSAGHPLVDWNNSPFFIDGHGGTIFDRSDAHFVGINSLGMGGTNVFIVVEPAPLVERHEPVGMHAVPIVLSAPTPNMLLHNVRALYGFVSAETPNLADLAYTLCVGRTQYAHRIGFVCRDKAALLDQLKRLIDKGETSAIKDIEHAALAAWLHGQNVDWHAHFPRTVHRLRLPAHAYQPTLCRLEANNEPIWWRTLTSLPEPSVQARAATRHESLRMIEQYCLCIVRDFMVSRGIDCSGNASCGQAELIQRLGMLPHYGRFGAYLIDALVARGYLTSESRRLRFSAQPGLPATEYAEQALLNASPEYAPMQRLLAHLSQHWPQVLCEGQSVSTVLPDEGLDAVAAALACDVDKSASIDSQFEHIDAFLRVFAARLGRPLRVVEIGCGHLALTDRLLGATSLEHIGEYWVTDADARYVSRARETFGRKTASGTCSIHFLRFDIDRSPAAQGFQPGTFDVVLGFNVLHVALDLTRALGNLAELLGDHGVACQIDAVDAQMSTQLIWGMLPDWWRHTDARANGPLLTVAHYRRLLETACTRFTLFADQEDLQAESVLWFASLRARSPSETYVPFWRRLVDVRSCSWEQDEVILVFADDPLIRSRIEGLAAGARSTIVGVARPGAQTHPQYTAVNLSDGLSMQALVDAAINQHRRIDRVVFAWDTPDLSEAQENALRESLGVLMATAAALDEATTQAEVEWLLISRGLYRVSGDERLRAEASLAFDMLKMIELEYPRFRLRHVELPLHAASIPIAFELACMATTDAETIAVRGRYLWQAVHERVELASNGGDMDLNGAVIVLVGGLGGLGMSIAHELVRRYRLHLVMIHRKPWLDLERVPNPATQTAEEARIHASLAELAEHALSLHLEKADANDREAMFAAAERIGRKYAKVDGVMYLAGEIDRHGILRKRLFDELAQSVRTKTVGVINASDAFATLHPAFQINFSSIGSVLHKAKFGEAGYVVGNGFLNAYARARSGESSTKIMCVNWTDWRTDGMWTTAQAAFKERYALRVSSPESSDDIFKKPDWLDSITVERGVDLLLDIASGNHSEVVVCPQDLPALLAYQQRATQVDYARYLDDLQLRAAVRTGPVSSAFRFERGTTAHSLAEIWEELLGTPVQALEDGFYASGGDSLLALRLVALLKQRCGVDLALSALLDAHTFEALVSHVDAKRAIEPGSREISVGL